MLRHQKTRTASTQKNKKVAAKKPIKKSLHKQIHSTFSNAPQKAQYDPNKQKHHKASAFAAQRVKTGANKHDDENKKNNHNNTAQTLANRLRRNNVIDKNTKWSEIDDIAFEPVMPPPEYDAEVPKLISGLRQVLQYDGPVSIGQMDEKTPYIDPKSVMKHIPQPDDINWEAIPPFVTSSRDPSLLKLAQDHGARFMGSTSSVSSILSQIHFTVTQHAPIKTSGLSHWFTDALATHTRASVKPSQSLLRKRGPSQWGIDNPPSGDPKQNQILIDLGKSLERHLTFEWDDFKRIFVREFDENGNPLENKYSPEEVAESEAHAFLKSGNILLRSQLDCDDETVRSDKKVFDLKTRATLPIRLDVLNHHNYTDYKVTAREGLYNSFEREFYDMGRSAFLKYSFQCRIGGMGGVFVAYHNTQELFGFEYIPIEKMDAVVYGSSDRANFVFRHGLNLMDQLTNRIVQDCAVPGREADTIRVTMDSSQTGKLVVFAETFPDVDLDDPIALDRALLCPHTGSVYIDWLSEEQARGALARRNLDTSGSRPQLISRLESHVCVPSVLYAPPTEDFVRELVEDKRFKVYNFYIDCHHTITNNKVDWSQITDDNLNEIKVRYSLREVAQEGNAQILARRYHSMLLDYNLIDRSNQPYQEVQLPAEVEQEVYNKFFKPREGEEPEEVRVGPDGEVTAVAPDEEQMAALTDEARKQLNDALFIAKRDYLSEVVDHVKIGSVEVPITRKDQVALERKKANMTLLMSNVGEYNQLDNMDQNQRAAAELKLKTPANKRYQHRRAI